MKEPYSGVRRGRERDDYDNWVRAQEQIAIYPDAKYRVSYACKETYAYASGTIEDIAYVAVHDSGNVTVTALTNEVRAALKAVGVAFTIS